MRLLVWTDDLALAALPLIELARSAPQAHIDIVALWTATADSTHPPRGAADFAALKAARELHLPDEEPGVLAGGVYVPQLAMLARELGIRCHEVRDRAAFAAAAAARQLEIDAGLGIGLREPLPAALLDAPRMGWLNLHPGRLPEHAGPAPAFWELRAGDGQSAMTLHRAGMALWDGAVLAIEPVSLASTSSLREISRRKGEAAGRLMAQVLPDLATLTGPGGLRGDAAAKSGNGLAVRVEPEPYEDDRHIDAAMQGAVIQRFVTALRATGDSSTSYFGPAWIDYQGARFALEGAPLAHEARPGDAAPGAIEAAGKGKVRLRCVDGWVVLILGKKMS